MNKKQVEQLVGALRRKYPRNVWDNAYPEGADVDDWAIELNKYSGEQVRHALTRLRDVHCLFPPTSMQFATLCDGYSAGAAKRNSECAAAECPLRTPGFRCSLHPLQMSRAEDLVVSDGIRKNADLVYFYEFIHSVKVVEIFEPGAWEWPERAAAGILNYPMLAGENIQDYKNRIAVITKRACGVHDRHLLPAQRQQKSLQYSDRDNPLQQMKSTVTEAST